MKTIENKDNIIINSEKLQGVVGGEANGGYPAPTPDVPIVSKCCPYKPCPYASRSQCPYYSKEIGDCNK